MSAQPSSARGPPSSATASVPSVSTAPASNFVPLPSSKGVVSSASATPSGFSSAIIAPSPSVSQSAIGSTMTSGSASSPSSQVPPIPPKSSGGAPPLSGASSGVTVPSVSASASHSTAASGSTSSKLQIPSGRPVLSSAIQGPSGLDSPSGTASAGAAEITPNPLDGFPKAGTHPAGGPSGPGGNDPADEVVDLFQREARSVGEAELIKLFGRNLFSRDEANALLGREFKDLDSLD